MKTLLLFFAFLLIAGTINAEQPFATKKSYNSRSFKKYNPKKSNTFACVKHKKVNKKGLTK